MGITGLLPFVKKASKNSHIKHLKGQTAAVDAYGWLYKGAFGCAEKLGKGEPTTVYVTFCMKYVNVLISHGVKPILVFDGRNLPAKAVTDEKRRKSRQENKAKAKEAIRKGKPAWEFFTRCINVTPKMARDLIKVLREQKIDYIIAPYEADAQLAYLARKGIADVVITEDSDLVLFGCPKIFFKMSLNGEGVLFDQSRIHLTLDQSPEKFQFDRFRQMCILSGCDYLPSLPGVGLGRAKKVFQISINPDVRQVLRQIPIICKLDLTVPPDYIQQFLEAENTFKYQLVFDPTIRTVVPLTTYSPDINPEDLHYAGKYEKKTLALDYALGNVDIHTNERVDNFDPQQSKSGYTKSSMWVQGFQVSKKMNLTTELRANTKHTSTNGLKLSIKGSSIMGKRSRSDSHISEDQYTDQASANVGDQDLLSIYGTEVKMKLDSDKPQSQEEEDDAIVNLSRRNKRICLSKTSIYSRIKDESLDSDGENNDSSETEGIKSDLNGLKTETESGSGRTLRTRISIPFLKSTTPQAQIKKSAKVELPSFSSRTKTIAVPLPICLVKKNSIYNADFYKNIHVKSKYFRNSNPETAAVKGSF